MRSLNVNELDTVSGGDLAPNIISTTAVTVGSSLGSVAGGLLGGPIGGAIGAGVGAGVGTAVSEYSHDIAKGVSDAVLNNTDIQQGMFATDWLTKIIFNL